jgi:hypothetical protein
VAVSEKQRRAVAPISVGTHPKTDFSLTTGWNYGLEKEKRREEPRRNSLKTKW